MRGLCRVHVLVGKIYAFLLRKVPNGRVWIKNVEKTNSSGCFNAANLMTIPLASSQWAMLCWLVSLVADFGEVQSEFGRPLPGVIGFVVDSFIGAVHSTVVVWHFAWLGSESADPCIA
ncbi:hypothetical protein A0H81_11100 [Grifola frondosa]|uniref:Uncharacterized protein n=1 Tax=Grifola frondosa TaxID=5627 RepID=A0A1C7LW28_GRIFR|nr:hypothetical protein A0H81_11100 [Grifola frondosa]